MADALRGDVREGTTRQKALVVRRNELIQAHYRMSLQEQRLLLWLIAQVKPEDTGFTVYRIGVRELAEFIGIEKGKGIYQQLAEHTKRLMSRVAEINKVDGTEVVQINFVSKTRYAFGKGVVELCLNQHMRPYLLQLKERFTEIELHQAIRLSSFYAIRIYEILKCEAFKGPVCEIALDELRARLGIEPGKLERSDNFKVKVLDIAQREINDRTDIAFEWAWIKSGRVISGVRFGLQPRTRAAVETLPGTLSDSLRIRLEGVGMPRAEAIRIVRQWIERDPARISWHLDELARRNAAGKVKAPLAWLRAGIKQDYRPQGSLFTAEERRLEQAEREADRRKRIAAARRAESAGPDAKPTAIGEILRNMRRPDSGAQPEA